MPKAKTISLERRIQANSDERSMDTTMTSLTDISPPNVLLRTISEEELAVIMTAADGSRAREVLHKLKLQREQFSKAVSSCAIHRKQVSTNPIMVHSESSNDNIADDRNDKAFRTNGCRQNVGRGGDESRAREIAGTLKQRRDDLVKQVQLSNKLHRLNQAHNHSKMSSSSIEEDCSESIMTEITEDLTVHSHRTLNSDEPLVVRLIVEDDEEDGQEQSTERQDTDEKLRCLSHELPVLAEEDNPTEGVSSKSDDTKDAGEFDDSKQESQSSSLVHSQKNKIKDTKVKENDLLENDKTDNLDQKTMTKMSKQRRTRSRHSRTAFQEATSRRLAEYMENYKRSSPSPSENERESQSQTESYSSRDSDENTLRVVQARNRLLGLYSNDSTNMRQEQQSWRRQRKVIQLESKQTPFEKTSGSSSSHQTDLDERAQWDVMLRMQNDIAAIRNQHKTKRSSQRRQRTLGPDIVTEERYRLFTTESNNSSRRSSDTILPALTEDSADDLYLQTQGILRSSCFDDGE